MKLRNALMVAALGLFPACNMLGGGGGSDSGGSGGATAPPPPTATDAPGWVTSPKEHPKFPEALYMTTTGHAKIEGGDKGEAREKAINNGMIQISQELNSDIKGETEIYMRELAVGDEYTTVSDYTSSIKNKTQSLLFGAKAGDSYEDRGANTLYILVAVERQTHARTLLKQVNTELAKASGERDQTTVSGKLTALIKEHVALEEVMPTLITLSVAVPNSHQIRAEFNTVYETVKERMRKIITELNDQEVAVSVVSGGEQMGVTGGQLAEPVVFRATAGGEPLVGFPVKFELEHDSKAELAAAAPVTDAKGNFSCKVVGLALTGDEENEVSGRLDYASFKEHILIAPSQTVYYALPTLKTSVFAIAIVETNLDTVLPESGVEGALMASLNKREAKVIDLSGVLSSGDVQEAATAGTDWIKSKLSGKVDYLIRGTARARASSAKNSLGAKFAYAGGSIEMIDVRSGAKAASHDVQPTSSSFKTSGSSFDDAGAKALAKFGKSSAGVFMKKIDAVFDTK